MAPLPKGVNPAPNHTTTMNAIDLLMASRPRQLLLQASSSSSAAKASSSSSSPLLARARAELQAGAHELGAAGEDNAGVGLHGPATAEERARQRDARRLEARLLGKRRAEERASRRRRGLEPGSSDDDDDEPGRSAVGRGKKRARTSRAEDEEQQQQEEEKKAHGNAADAPAATAREDRRDASVPDPADVAPAVASPHPSEPPADAEPGETPQPKKKKRKNKKKKKAAGLPSGDDES